MSALNHDSIHVVNSLAIANLPKAEIEKHRGEFAILIGGAVCSYHKTNREAVLEARARYATGQFSVQKVEVQPVDDFALFQCEASRSHAPSNCNLATRA